jgi:hypothetical protein
MRGRSPKVLLIAGSAATLSVSTDFEIAALWSEVSAADARLGGYLSPFVDALAIGSRDFRVEGAADLRRPAPASPPRRLTILYRDLSCAASSSQRLAGRTHGLLTLAGSRPGGGAAAWAVSTTWVPIITRPCPRHDGHHDRLIDGINSIEGLYVLGQPDMSVFAFGFDSFDIHAVADQLEAAGWHPDRQQLPPSVHCMVTPAHKDVVQPFLADLKRAVDDVSVNAPAPSGRAAMYGMLDKMPDRAAFCDVVLDSIDRLTRVKEDATAVD